MGSMFKSATFRLTLAFLGILMLISLFFSVLVYNVSSRELSRNFQISGNGAPGIVRTFETDVEDIQEFFRARARQGRRRLMLNLFYMNVGLLLLGGGASYLLARYTLRPIEEAHEAQSRFTADASHELRTPLAAMRAEIEVALRDPKFSKAHAKTLLQSNLEELDKLTVLSDGLLRLARLETNQLPEEPVGIKEVAQEAINRVLPLAEKKHILIEEKLDKITVPGDKGSLTELLVTLLDNAVKYSAEKTSVSIVAKKLPKYALIEVRDHGQGIKATEVPHIFERFYRADSSRSKIQVGGYGLGLSIAQSIALLHGSKITVESTPGKGSVFSLKLPLLDT